MTANLPRDLLELIFKELSPCSPEECQYVCKSWYLPAHTVCLNNIYIDFSTIPRFIASIDCNPDPPIWEQSKRPLLKKEMMTKLFCRFPNLKNVTLIAPSGTFDDFNDYACKAILEKCRKLDKFEVCSELEPCYHYDDDLKQKSEDNYLDAQRKIRLLLTKVHFRGIDFTSRPESSVEFISQFPRLNTIYGVPGLNKFEQLLPVFLHLSNLKDIEMRQMLEDQEDFAETYIAAKTKEEQEQLVKSLSSVKNLIHTIKIPLV